jgi:hypothetical protein
MNQVNNKRTTGSNRTLGTILQNKLHYACPNVRTPQQTGGPQLAVRHKRTLQNSVNVHSRCTTTTDSVLRLNHGDVLCKEQVLFIRCKFD